MELAWLEDFVALAELENFSRAADARHVTQPAFSRRIRALENWMGVDLFERTTQGATLTDVGRQMLGNAQDMTRRLHQMRLDARELAGKQLRTLYFAATHSLSFNFFPGWIRSIERDAPIEAVRLHSDNMRVCEQMLLNGEVQFLLCHHHPDVPPRFPNEQFLGKTVGSDVLLPLCAPAAVSAQATSLSYLGYTAESGLGRIINWRLNRSQPQAVLDTRFSSHLAAVLLSMALEGKGLAWLPSTLADHELQQQRLTRALDEQWDIAVQIRLFRARTPLSDFAEAFWANLP
ncbi:LysR family transcriptional regulator [Pseudomonas sp.]|uniref:LysR family transcriptional regulator n=1 Tax=Pseudomonas sp. TaxID=306 RepID=UPI003CC64DEC